MKARLRLTLSSAALAGGVALLVLAGMIRPAEAGGPPRGGTFRILTVRGGVDAVDPAQAYDVASWAILDASCALLLRRPDLPPPAGYRPVPEVAASYPTVSSDGKTYTFTTRKGFRFSDGSPLTARNFAVAIGRLKNPALDSPAEPFTREIVSARALAPNRLVIRLSKRLPEFTARLTLPFFCPVPLGLPNVPEGAGAPFSGAGPYYVARWQLGGELVAARNRFFRGKRAQNVDQFLVRETESPDGVAPFRAVERGEADWFAGAPGGVGITIREEFARKYGVNRSQYFVLRSAAVFYLALNTERLLFRNNVRLRQAVNFAVDRPAVLRAYGPRQGNPTDQLLPPTMPGFRNALLYPLKRPNLTKARALARGRTRGGKAVLYILDTPFQRVAGAVIRANLEQIGIVVEIKPFPPGPFSARVGTRGESYDMAYLGWGADYVDPGNFLNLLDGRTIRDRENVNNSYFNSSGFNRKFDRANRLAGNERLRALGELDVRVARTEAPLVPLFHPNQHVFVSRRVGCLVFNNHAGSLNVGASCLKR